MNGVLLHRAGLASAAVIAELQALCFSDDIAAGEVWSRESVANLLASPGVLALIASEGSQPCGYLLLRCVADEAEVLSLGVLPGCRRRGIARNLLCKAGQFCRDSGAMKLHLEVAADNAAALALYFAIGFRRVGSRKDYYQRQNGSRIAALLLTHSFDGDEPSF